MSDVLPIVVGTWGVAMALSPLLQIRTVVRNRSSADVSLGYLGVLTIGFALWLTYAISIDDVPLTITNATALVVSVATFVVVLRFRPSADGDA